MNTKLILHYIKYDFKWRQGLYSVGFSASFFTVLFAYSVKAELDTAEVLLYIASLPFIVLMMSTPFSSTSSISPTVQKASFTWKYFSATVTNRFDFLLAQTLAGMLSSLPAIIFLFTCSFLFDGQTEKLFSYIPPMIIGGGAARLFALRAKYSASNYYFEVSPEKRNLFHLFTNILRFSHRAIHYGALAILIYLLSSWFISLGRVVGSFSFTALISVFLIFNFRGILVVWADENQKKWSFVKDGALTIIFIMSLAIVSIFYERHKIENQSKKDHLFSMIEGNDIDKIKDATLDEYDLDSFNDRGRTPLIEAIIKNRYEVVKILIDKGAKVNQASDEGLTPVGYASYFCWTPIVELLVSKGADIHYQDRFGLTPIFYPTRSGCLTTILYLEKSGASLLHKDKKGRDLFKYTIETNPQFSDELNFYFNKLR